MCNHADQGHVDGHWLLHYVTRRLLSNGWRRQRVDFCHLPSYLLIQMLQLLRPAQGVCVRFRARLSRRAGPAWTFVAPQHCVCVSADRGWSEPRRLGSLGWEWMSRTNMCAAWKARSRWPCASQGSWHRVQSAAQRGRCLQPCVEATACIWWYFWCNLVTGCGLRNFKSDIFGHPCHVAERPRGVFSPLSNKWNILISRLLFLFACFILFFTFSSGGRVSVDELIFFKCCLFYILSSNIGFFTHGKYIYNC